MKELPCLEENEEQSHDIAPAQEAGYDENSKTAGAYFDGAPERIGNNRYHVPKALAIRRKKLSLISKRKNRK